MGGSYPVLRSLDSVYSWLAVSMVAPVFSVSGILEILSGVVAVRSVLCVLGAATLATELV
ncbi:MAG TPA: hypothetical protein VLS45_06700 [Methylomicrobium sp.]|nr:hypothetical protein [Methylomicrobium sp.]